MRSLDTNVIVRVLLQDNVEQARVAAQALAEPALLLATVVLETVWVLTGKAWSRAEIVQALRRLLLEFEHLLIPDEDALIWATDRFEAGGDFADLLHVGLSGQASTFATFDRKLERYCGGAPVRIELLTG